MDVLTYFMGVFLQMSPMLYERKSIVWLYIIPTLPDHNNT